MEITLQGSAVLLLTFSFYLEAHGFRRTDVTYSEIVQLKASCPEYDSCQNVSESTFVDTLERRHCECGPHCVQYSTCCVDSPNRVPVSRTRMQQIPECVTVRSPFGGTKSYRMISKCHPRWRGSQSLKNMCQRITERDPFSLIPATDIEMNNLYRNFFCGVCNGIEPGVLKLWNIELSKTTQWNNKSDENAENENILIDQMVFNEKLNTWGVWETDSQGELVFQNIYIYSIPPQEYTRTHCIRDLVSNCNPMWKDRVVQEKCNAYMAAVFTSDERYRNVHCAICNFVDLERGIICSKSFTWSVPLSFTLLLDVNTKDGKDVGKIKQCRDGESYDPFFKKCRALVCGLPGYSINNGRCTQT